MLYLYSNFQRLWRWSIYTSDHKPIVFFLSGCVLMGVGQMLFVHGIFKDGSFGPLKIAVGVALFVVAAIFVIPNFFRLFWKTYVTSSAWDPNADSNKEAAMKRNLERSLRRKAK